MKFSEKYYKDLNLSPYQHYVNNVWFINTLDKLKDTGKLYIPDINKTFNKYGDLIEWIYLRDLKKLSLFFILYSLHINYLYIYYLHNIINYYDHFQKTTKGYEWAAYESICISLNNGRISHMPWRIAWKSQNTKSIPTEWWSHA